MTSRCTACGVAFECGRENRAPTCWCAELPRIMPLELQEACLCPVCLKARLRERIAAFVRTVTPATALTCGARAYATDDPPVEGIDYEIDARGLMVFTAWYLLKRGSCCESGCRHCPYGFSA